MIDFQPSPSGTVGQIINFSRNPDEMTWVASSFEELLQRAFALLESDPDYVLQDIGQDGPLPRRRERRDDSASYRSGREPAQPVDERSCLRRLRARGRQDDVVRERCARKPRGLW